MLSDNLTSMNPVNTVCVYHAPPNFSCVVFRLRRTSMSVCINWRRSSRASSTRSSWRYISHSCLFPVMWKWNTRVEKENVCLLECFTFFGFIIFTCREPLLWLEHTSPLTRSPTSLLFTELLKKKWRFVVLALSRLFYFAVAVFFLSFILVLILGAGRYSCWRFCEGSSWILVERAEEQRGCQWHDTGSRRRNSEISYRHHHIRRDGPYGTQMSLPHHTFLTSNAAYATLRVSI